ncbi:LysR family transcriptional regulator [Rosistilla oblonga]|uniref:HTH-type transcriptional regulator CynR n=1 Tax=Rosistilla oblonga TaxID=2527990 RepID=A0A518J2B5_9BACT|nr:LysR family transcriptional regulator [Rosistilla oblonga]QDV59478.1 HTH-type transcriptional regulator CynR [Rosistilla oblonga]
MELDQLRNFLRVAEFGNFTRAAEAIGLSQPALSRSIARLEEELGQPVFERQPRLIALTDAGHILHDRARQILALVDDVHREITDDGETGTIRLAGIPTIVPYFLPPLLREFGQACPEATVRVQEDTTEVLLKQLADGETDLAILARPLDAKHLDFEDLFEEELLLVMSPQHPLRDKPQIHLADLDAMPFVLLGEAHCLTRNIVQFCQQKSLQPVSVERTSQLASVQELVTLGHGISLIPAMARALDASDRRIYRSLAGNQPTRQIVMAWNPYRFQSKLVLRFQECLRSFVQNHPPKAPGHES